MPDKDGGTVYQVTDPHGFCRYCTGHDVPTFPSKTGDPICRPCKVLGKDT